MERPLRMGAVAYDPKVVPIWDGIRDYVTGAGAPMDHRPKPHSRRRMRQAGILACREPAHHKRLRSGRERYARAGHVCPGTCWSQRVATSMQQPVNSLADDTGKAR